MSNLKSRILVGSAYVVLTIACLLFDIGSGILYLGMVQLLCLNEFYRLTVSNYSIKKVLLDLLVGCLVMVLVYGNQDDVISLGRHNYLIIPSILVYLISTLYNKSDSWISDITASGFGWIYISASFGLFLRLSNVVLPGDKFSLLPYNGRLLLSVFILVWVYDTFAYLTGKRFGKTKLAPQISPKKTVEGLLGGMVFTMGASLLLSNWFKGIGMEHLMILGAICAIVGTAGDLFESRLKRSLGIKDSGNALGGHGGFLDRMDSILFAGPASYFYFVYVVLEHPILW